MGISNFPVYKRNQSNHWEKMHPLKKFNERVEFRMDIHIKYKARKEEEFGRSTRANDLGQRYG